MGRNQKISKLIKGAYKMSINIRIEITVKNVRFLYSTLNNPRLQLVKGKNGFIQFGRMAIIWRIK
jgi:hypothetical protein